MAMINAPVTGSVWRVLVAVGDSVSPGDEVMILESMKMEIPVEAEDHGTVKQVFRHEGESVAEDERLIEVAE